MVAVMMGSRNVGSTSWAAVRGRKWIFVEGMVVGKDELRITMRSGSRTHSLEIIESCGIEIPPDVDSVMAEHIQSSGNPVFVDMR